MGKQKAKRNELSYHPPSGQYYKTCRRKRYYFGKDEAIAQQRFELEWPFISRGLPVPAEIAATGVPVGQVMDLWVDARANDLVAGRIGATTFAQYKRVAQFQVSELGARRVAASLSPVDFAKLREAMPGVFGVSAVALKRTVTICRMPWKWAFDSGLIDKPMRYGPDFKAPSEADRRQQRFDRGRQVFTADELRTMLGQASPMMRAAIMLGINGGYTQKEVAVLDRSVVDLDAALIDHLRAKTKQARTVPLMPETVAALLAYLGGRAKASAKGLLFVTAAGGPVRTERINAKGNLVTSDALGDSFARLKGKAGIELDRAGFGKLRATFRTVADAAGDANAARRIMGHDLGQGVESSYIREIDHARLKAVVEHVRSWLFEAA
ncbi:MAG: site-specific integrase [Phycisphaeraceae bacterium]